MKKFLKVMLASLMVLSLVTNVQAAKTYKPGVTVETSRDEQYDADYKATFVYEDTDERDAVSVRVEGNFYWYSWEDPAVKDYKNTGKLVGSDVRDAYHYEDGMFNTSGDVEGKAGIKYVMTETSDERFEITLPLPGNLYFYDYYVTYADSNKEVKLQDPANPSPKNEWNGHDDSHSTFRVGTPTNTTKGQEYIYDIGAPKGSVEFVTYMAADGTEQPLGVYLPANYDASKTYKTLYVSHGGGGNEFEWMSLGAAPTIMDNLIAAKEVDEAIVVTMDHTYFNWKYDVIAKNFKENMIPYIEANYSVSKEAEDRALCGLSMGSMMTSTMLLQYTDLFGYYGCFSGSNVSGVPDNLIDVDKIKTKGIYVTAGNVDMALRGFSTGTGTVHLAEKLDELGVEYTYDLKGGAHDWGVWRDELTTFAKDILWEADYEGASKYNPGVTVEANKDEQYDADYKATFVYEDKDDRNAISVRVEGNFFWYSWEDPAVKDYVNTGKLVGSDVRDAYNYEDGMFNASGDVEGKAGIQYYLNETDAERFELTLPLPGNLYFYDYYVTYDDGSTVKMQDPVNPSPKNEWNGHDDGHSTFRVGTPTNTTKGQEYIYDIGAPKGEVEFVTYMAVDGTEQPLGVYLPANYDASKTYKTLYVSHGGGGNEFEWMSLGAAPTIMDNLIAAKEVDETIVVTMDHTYFGWKYDVIAENFEKYMIPYIEANYSVSKEIEDRALCGLSMGSMTTSTMMLKYPDLFGYYGNFSGSNLNAVPKDQIDVEKLKTKGIYVTAGNIDMALMASNGNLSNKTVGLALLLDELGVEYTYDLKGGAHDWGVWRDELTTFAKDVLWEASYEGASDYKVGVTLEDNTNKDWAADYTATFVFEDTDDRNAIKVEILGGFQFYKLEETNKYETPDDARTPVYSAYDYEDGMFPTGYVLGGSSMPYTMKETSDDRFEITLPLPGNLYYYDYKITYDDGSVVTMQDPTNPSPKNPLNGHDAAHSLLYVGDRTNTAVGQEYVYARDGQNGKLEYVTYTNISGTEQPLGIYLPYNYDPSKTYKTIYVVHGGGGNEADWMTIGAVPNIMDNLIAEGEVAEAIIVTPWNANGNSVDNVVQNIIPFIEANYSVSKDPKDRAICGLSAGGSFTANALMYANDEFGYYGVWSPSNTYLADRIASGEITEEMYKSYNDAVYYIGVGIVDNQRRRTAELSLYDTLKDTVKAEATFEYKNGAHDWYVWRDFLTTFVKDVVWDAPEAPVVTPTGDSTPIAMYAVIGVCAIAAFVALRKKEEN